MADGGDTPVTTPDSTAATPQIDRLLRRARARISRIDVHEAARLLARGALVVDTRPVEQRREHGAIPGSTAIERNVLEWRLDPTSPDRLPIVDEHDGSTVVYCQQGYSSSFAVASLVDLGLDDVHDLVGGFEAWAAAGLPVTAVH
ncbi:MAG TPA: rhodanese-like domain-containing protein [Ilumatobacteraceae bacterium]